MIFLALGPAGTKSGEVTTYNGDGWIDHRDVLYVHTFAEDDTTAEVGIYADGYDDSGDNAHLDAPFIVFQMAEDGTEQTMRWWGGPTSGAAKMLFKPDNLSPTSDECLVKFTVESGAAKPKVIVDLNAPGEVYEDILRLRSDVDKRGIKYKQGTADFLTNALEIQWEESESAMSVDMFKGGDGRDYSQALGLLTGNINQDFQFKVYGASRLKGSTYIGNDDANEEYELPRMNPVVGKSVPAGEDADHRFPLYDGTAGTPEAGNPVTLKWWRLEAADASIGVTYDDAKRIIKLTATGGVTGQNIDVVTNVSFDVSQNKLKVERKTISVIDNDVATLTDVFIGESIDAVIDNAVGTTTLEHTKKTLYVIGAAAGDTGSVSYHTGNTC